MNDADINFYFDPLCPVRLDDGQMAGHTAGLRLLRVADASGNRTANTLRGEQ